MVKVENKNEDKRASYYWGRVRDYGKKYKWFHWSSVELFLNLVYTYDIISNHFAAKLKIKGLSRAAFNVLNIISRSENKGCIHVELSELLLVSRANVTGLVDSLARRGLVERRDSPSDRRLSIVKITRKGEELLNSTIPFYYLEMRKLASVLNNEERDKLNKVLVKLRLKASALSKDGKRE